MDKRIEGAYSAMVFSFEMFRKEFKAAKDSYDELEKKINELSDTVTEVLKEERLLDVTIPKFFANDNELEKVIFPEMEKLEEYLVAHDISYETKWRKMPTLLAYNSDRSFNVWNREEKLYKQILVPNEEKRQWDAICHPGSYGFEDGQLEIYGDILTPEDEEYDSVVGHLTADEVIKRIELKEKCDD